VQYAHPEDGINLTYIQQTGETQTNGDGGDQYVGLDRFGRVIDQNWWNPTTKTSTDRFQYGYDRSGDVLYSNNLVNSAESELYRANSTQSGDSNTAYDGLGRQVAFARGTLSSSGHNGSQLDTIASPSRTQSWSLDALGNWSGATTNGSTTTRTSNAQNQTTTVSGGTAPTYDHNGDTTSDSGLTYVYNAWNELVAVKNGSTVVASYAYDALGRRITETYGSTVNHLYYSPQWQVIEERQNGTGTSNVIYQYVWGAGYVDELVLRDTYSGGVKTQRLYAQWNADYSVTALVNTSGQVQERYLYDPYGSVTVTDANWNPRTGNQSAFGWRYLFQGGRLDTTTGWYEFRNRDLIPSEGRWAERDPLEFGGGDLNLYRDLGSNPLDMTDPSGLSDNPLGNYGYYFGQDYGGIGNTVGRWTVGWIYDWDGAASTGSNLQENLAANESGSAMRAGAGQNANEALSQFDQPGISSGSAYSQGGTLATPGMTRSGQAVVTMLAPETGGPGPRLRPSAAQARPASRPAPTGAPKRGSGDTCPPSNGGSAPPAKPFPKGWRLPQNGTWSGPPGNSDFIPRNPKALGVPQGTRIPFSNGYPDFSQWSKGSVSVPGLNGSHANDMPLIWAAVAKQQGLPSANAGRNWLAAQSLTPHHAGGDCVQLVPKALHGGVRHTGGAWALRNQ
jgi:RHS repeat-associated protein